MITRTYDVLMPDDNADVDILVEGDADWGAVGVRTGPVVDSGDTGFYVEWRNRRIRVPVKAGSAAAVASGFVARFQLGFGISIVELGAGVAREIPEVQCSRSLVGDVFSTAADATTPGDATFQDPSDAPTIRILGSGSPDTGGRKYRVSLWVAEAQDEDRSNQVG